MIKNIKVFLPIIFTILIITLFHFTHWIVVKYYPAVMNFCIFMMFFVSSFQKETMLNKIAKKLGHAIQITSYPQKGTVAEIILKGAGVRKR